MNGAKSGHRNYADVWLNKTQKQLLRYERSVFNLS